MKVLCGSVYGCMEQPYKCNGTEAVGAWYLTPSSQQTLMSSPETTTTTVFKTVGSGAVGRPSRSVSTNRGMQGSRSVRSESPDCTSPTSSEQSKRLPIIKPVVGLAKGPDLTSVKSKIGSLDNVKHKPAGGKRVIPQTKLEWTQSSRVRSKVGSLENHKHKPGGGDLKVLSQKLDWKANSKIGSLDNVKHKPGGGNIQIFDEKYTKGQSRSSSRVRVHTPANNNSSNTGSQEEEKSVSKNQTDSQHEDRTGKELSSSSKSSDAKPVLPPKPAVRKTSNGNNNDATGISNKNGKTVKAV